MDFESFVSEIKAKTKSKTEKDLRADNSFIIAEQISNNKEQLLNKNLDLLGIATALNLVLTNAEQNNLTTKERLSFKVKKHLLGFGIKARSHNNNSIDILSLIE